MFLTVRLSLLRSVSLAVLGLWTAFGTVQRREFSPNLHHYSPAELPQLASTIQCGIKAMFVVRLCPLFPKRPPSQYQCTKYTARATL